MQEDTHKNQKFTSKQLLAEEYLKEIGFLSIPNKVNVLTMEKKYIVNTKPIEIIISIGSNFPLEYPKFYTKEDSMFLMYQHIEKKDSRFNAYGICLFTENDKMYYDNIDFLLNDNINQLEKFLQEVEDNTFLKDELFDEFDSYWDTTGLVLHYNKDNISQNKALNILDLYVSKSTQKLLIIEDNKNVENFFYRIGTPYEKKKIIYIDFDNIFPQKIPSTIQEFLTVVDNIGYLEEFKKYKKVKDLFNGILFSFLLPNGEKHYSFLFIEQSKMQIGRKIKVINPIIDILNPLGKNRKLGGGTAKDISDSRIYSRGGNDMNKAINRKSKKIAIVGCGSIGALLAYKLLKIGCTNLLLIDDERLSVDNISRHLLGMDYINFNKAVALQDFLSKQFVNSNIDSIGDSVASHLGHLESCDLIVSALGSDAKIVETKMIQDAVIGNLPPVISCWVEANAVAGHSIFFNKNSIDSGFNIYNQVSNIFNSITILVEEYSRKLQKDDVGCNSNYMPYSFLNSDLHINHFTLMITEYLLGHKIEPIFSSIGNLSEVYEYLKDDYKSLDSFTLLKKSISEESDI